MSHQMPLFKDGDTCLAEQAKLITQMYRDGRISRQAFKMFIERMAQKMKDRQLTHH